jgi:hypothetical protein
VEAARQRVECDRLASLIMLAQLWRIDSLVVFYEGTQ